MSMSEMMFTSGSFASFWDNDTKFIFTSNNQASIYKNKEDEAIDEIEFDSIDELRQAIGDRAIFENI